jgi:hypothetical protein
MYARAYLEGRLSEDQLDGFRQEKSHPTGGPFLVPPPPFDARVLAVPHCVHGPRPHQRDLSGTS